MSPDEIRASIATALYTSWATCTEISWPNLSFTPPQNTAWIKPRIVMGSSEEGEIGESGVGVRAGTLLLSIFIPVNGGVSEGNVYAARLENLFRRQVLNGVMFGEPFTTDIGPDGSGSYHIQTVIPFQTFIGE